MAVIRALHFSDVHVDVPASQIPLGDWLGKRLIGGANHALRRGRHFREAREKLSALASFAASAQIDLSVCTGDYTVLGSDAELGAAAAAVEPLTRPALGFVTVPGNHDLYVPDTTRERRFEKHFGKWLTTDCPELAVDGGWPLVRIFGDSLAVVAISSARPNPQPWRSSGLVPAAQLEALVRALDDERLRDRFVLVITHYAVRLASGDRDRATHALDNADELMRVLAPRRRVALLHGHVHQRYRLDLPHFGPTILGAGSATMEGREGFWLLEIERDAAFATPGAYVDGRYVLLEDQRAPLSA